MVVATVAVNMAVQKNLSARSYFICGHKASCMCSAEQSLLPSFFTCLFSRFTASCLSRSSHRSRACNVIQDKAQANGQTSERVYTNLRCYSLFVHNIRFSFHLQQSLWYFECNKIIGRYILLAGVRARTHTHKQKYSLTKEIRVFRTLHPEMLAKSISSCNCCNEPQFMHIFTNRHTYIQRNRQTRNCSTNDYK